MSTPSNRMSADASQYFPGFEVDAVVFYGDPTRIYRARRRSTGESVMLKTLQDERAAREAAAWLKHEFEVTRRLNTPSVIQVYDLERHNNLPVMVLEDFGGDSLDNLARQRRFSLEALLKIAIQLARGLMEIHSANVIHKDINPSNIVHNPDTGMTKIIDFGISTYLTREQAALSSPQVFEGSLPYISPEQTGRMNRSIDYRTDYYSLGVTLYELLTGQPLFIVNEPIEWFHCHIAKQPVPPVDINPDIPEPVSDIVMKLLAKTAEDRYQSARGIQADLERCLEKLRRTGDINPFTLGTRDISDRFQIPQRLYGRDEEIAQLMSAFESVGHGETKMILVSGYSGIGKTCLIKEIYKPVTERRGHFVSGKFDQLHRNIPYSAITAALRDLVRQLLTEPEDRLAAWRETILAALGRNGRLMIEIIHELELIIGPQPDVPECSPLEAEQRFHRVFQQFVQVFCGPAHPLVVFLDDLQWADSASMKLLDLLHSGESSITHLLFIGAYRDNEIQAGHPVSLWLKEIRDHQVPLTEIQLQPLNREHLTDLLMDTLGAERFIVTPLAEIVEQKTAGNPFFTEEFLKSLHQQGFIVFSRESFGWTCDIERILVQQMTDNVIDLMTDKLRQLAPDTRRLLELGACIGFRFRLEMLAVVAEATPALVARQLHEAVTQGFIAPIDDAYQLLELDQTPDTADISVEFAFAHDRIHQAAYALLDAEQRCKSHLKIGRLLLNSLPEAQRDEHLFEITNHLNLGLEHIDDPHERTALCRLNLQSGKRAKQANAYYPADNHLQTALALLSENAWESDYGLALEIHKEAAEAAYLTGDYHKMDDLVKSGIASCKDLLDKINFHVIHISACMARGRPLEAIATAKPVLAQLGHVYPAKPNKLHVVIKLIRLKMALRKKTIEDIRKLPPMSDPKHLAAMKIGGQIGGAAMFAEPNLLPLMVLQGAITSFEHGHAPQSLSTYPALGMIFSDVLGEVDRGQAFGRMGMELTQQLQAKAIEGRVHHVYYAFVRHWKEPIRDCLDPLRETFRICLDSGDFEYASHAIVLHMLYAFQAGRDLPTLLDEMVECHTFMNALKQGPRIHYMDCCLQAIDNFLGKSEDPAVLVGRFCDIEQLLSQHQQSGDNSLVFVDSLQQMQLSYYFGRYPEALAQTERAGKAAEGVVAGNYLSLPLSLYDALIRLSNVPTANSRKRRRLLRQVARNHAKLKRWAKMNPANGLNKQLLVEADRLRILRRDFEAHPLYDESIRLARENAFIQEEALACELCGVMHMASGRKTIGEPYLAKARDLYDHWGAQAKVVDLEQRYPQIIKNVTRLKGSTTSTGSLLSGIDIGSLMKALKAIAAEQVHSRMVEAIITTAIEFAGAQLGMLILRNPTGKLCIEAEVGVDNATPRILQSIPIRKGNLSQAVVNYVARSSTSIVIHDAQQPSDQIPGLNQDPHVQNHGVRSLLCLPIITGTQDQGELVGLLYLENNRASGTFTQERFDTLEIICLSAAGRLELSRKAIIDGLTELYNHNYFHNLLSQEFASSRRHGRDLALLMIDIDHFKKFNDTWGHQAGDRVLREVALLIKSSCRGEDTVTRYGGEEIAVILPVTNREKAKLVAERIRAAIEKQSVEYEGEHLKVTISVGVAVMTAAALDKDALIRLADEALYLSKAQGRNRVTVA